MKTPFLIASLVVAGALAQSGSALAALPAQADTPIPTLAPMIKKVSPTVVGIATQGTPQRQRNPLLDDPFFRRFFGDVPPQAPQGEVPLASGSGVVVDAKNGYIITNAHVIANATRITVTLDDGNEIEAEVVGKDEGSDIALLKAKNARLNAIPLGDSSALEVGDFVVAIGNPFGLEHTVTSGIVSALGRSNIGAGDPNSTYQDFIQTDASINPGNSGGALVNLKGELIGINAAIFSASGGNIGIGFAIPVNMVKSVMQQLVQYGEVKRGMLGVIINTLTPNIAPTVGAPANLQGALVTQIERNSSAEQAGIKVGDVITAVNDRAVRNGADLRNMIGMLRVGEKARLGIFREGKQLTLTATVAERKPEETAEPRNMHPAFEGAELANAENDTGVLVRNVTPGSPAFQVGLRANDVIHGVNRERVQNLEHLQRLVKDVSVLGLNVRRGNRELIILMR